MDFSALIPLVISHAWIPVAVLVVAYLVRLTADDSKFPVSVAPQWHPVIAVFLADLLIFLKAWPNWRAGLDPALLIALGALALKAYYANKPEPVWVKWVVSAVPTSSVSMEVTRTAADGHATAAFVKIEGEENVAKVAASIAPQALPAKSEEPPAVSYGLMGPTREQEAWEEDQRTLIGLAPGEEKDPFPPRKG